MSQELPQQSQEQIGLEQSQEQIGLEQSQQQIGLEQSQQQISLEEKKVDIKKKLVNTVPINDYLYSSSSEDNDNDDYFEFKPDTYKTYQLNINNFGDVVDANCLKWMQKCNNSVGLIEKLKFKTVGLFKCKPVFNNIKFNAQFGSARKYVCLHGVLFDIENNSFCLIVPIQSAINLKPMFYHHFWNNEKKCWNLMKHKLFVKHYDSWVVLIQDKLFKCGELVQFQYDTNNKEIIDIQKWNFRWSSYYHHNKFKLTTNWAIIDHVFYGLLDQKAIHSHANDTKNYFSVLLGKYLSEKNAIGAVMLTSHLIPLTNVRLRFNLNKFD